VGLELDKARFAEDAGQREQAQDRIALLTPVAKAFLTDRGFETTILGQQIFGGHGYIRENGMEQFVRDCRIAQIYEGTNGIQALDLAGRKVARNGGQSVQGYVAEIRQWVENQNGLAHLDGIQERLEGAIDLLEQTTTELIRQASDNPNAVNAGAVEYLDLFGYVTLAWLWARMMVSAAGRNDDFGRAKLTTGRFYFERLLPRAEALATQIQAGPETLMGLDEALF
jgi:hypothetical protein